jgi:hypothetical protein
LVLKFVAVGWVSHQLLYHNNSVGLRGVHYNIVYPVLSYIILLIRFYPVSCIFLAYTILVSLSPAPAVSN